MPAIMDMLTDEQLDYMITRAHKDRKKKALIDEMRMCAKLFEQEADTPPLLLMTNPPKNAAAYHAARLLAEFADKLEQL